MIKFINMDFDTFVLLTESKGIPQIVKNITDILISKFFKNSRKFLLKKDLEYNIYLLKFSHEDLNELFFHDLFVYLYVYDEFTKKDSFYNYNINEWNENFKMFNQVVIRIYINKNEINDLSRILAHELIHAYEDHCRIIKTNKGFLNINPDEFSLETVKQIEIKEKFGDNPKLNKLYYYTYYLLFPERRANIGAIYYELKEFELTKQDIDDGKYKDMLYYKIYLQIKENISNLMKSLTDEEAKLFGEYIKGSAFKKLHSNNLQLFKQRIIVNFKKYSEETMFKMRKLTYSYLSDNHLMENFKLIEERSKMLRLMGIEEIKNELNSSSNLLNK
jgi:hypothetical protein